jgi:hypothetical protein
MAIRSARRIPIDGIPNGEQLPKDGYRRGNYGHRIGASKAYAFEGGVLFPVYQRNHSMQPEERFGTLNHEPDYPDCRGLSVLSLDPVTRIGRTPTGAAERPRNGLNVLCPRRARGH